MATIYKQYPWAKVFRVITDHAEADPDLRRVLAAPVRSWKGTDADKTPLQAGADGPVIRLTPMPRAVQPYSPVTEVCRLDVLVEASVPSLKIDDVLNLWGTICDAVSYRDEAYRQALVDAGAETGDIFFTDPMLDPKPAADPTGVFNAQGVFSLRVLRTIV